MEKIKRFFECLMPVTACNLKCSYCYIIQRNHRFMNIPKLNYSVEQIGRALTKDRLGGTCYFSICGAGETLLGDKIVELTHELLRQGHYVNITTNGTITNKFLELRNISDECLSRLHVSFSFHYLELIRINKLEDFFQNVRFMKEAGASILVQLNMCDEYVPHLEKIKTICLQEIGALPQIAATRKEISLSDRVELLTEHTEDEYLKWGGSLILHYFNLQ